MNDNIRRLPFAPYFYHSRKIREKAGKDVIMMSNPASKEKVLIKKYLVTWLDNLSASLEEVIPLRVEDSLIKI